MYYPVIDQEIHDCIRVLQMKYEYILIHINIVQTMTVIKHLWNKLECCEFK